MLKIFVRATARRWPLCQLRLQQYASFTVRDILRETSDETGTLLSRFAKHIAVEVRKGSPPVATTIRYSDYFPVTDLRYFQEELKRTASDQLPALITFAFTYRPSADPVKFAVVLNDLDDAAVKCLSQMDTDAVLNTLYALLFLMPNWITRTDFYGAAMERLADNDFAEESSTEQFVQLCFYLGLDKKHGAQHNNQQQLLQHTIQQHLEHHLPQLGAMDLAVVCSAAYKTATSIRSSSYEERLVQEVLALPLDGAHDALLVTFIKAMRFQRIRSEQVCNYLMNICTSRNALHQMQARGLVHLFAYFAENLWDKDECTEALIMEFMSRLSQDRNLEYVRAKDIGMFLWCCSQLHCNIPETELKYIEDIIMDKVRNDEFRLFANQLVDCSLSLWTLGNRSHKIVQEAVRLKAQTRPSAKRQPKVDCRLTVLLAAAAIEAPALAAKLPTTRPAFDVKAVIPEYLLKDRSDLFKYIDQIQQEDSVKSAEIVCPIAGINIPGILVQFHNPDESEIFVEFLTNEQTLRFSKEPVAIFRLKKRLLNALGHKVVMLTPSHMNDGTNKWKELLLGCVTDDDPLPKEQLAGSV